jgi:hypothetical protein
MIVEAYFQKYRDPIIYYPKTASAENAQMTADPDSGIPTSHANHEKCSRDAWPDEQNWREAARAEPSLQGGVQGIPITGFDPT